MRNIGIRKLQQNFYKEVKDLPLCITKNRKPWLYIYDKEINNTIGLGLVPGGLVKKEPKMNNKKMKSTAKKIEKSNKVTCPHGSMWGLCKKGCKL